MIELADKRVLVTGGLGFIGSHLVKRLVGLGAKVTILGQPSTSAERLGALAEHIQIQFADLRDHARVVELVKKTRPQLVYHLAAAGVTDPFLPHEVATAINVTGTLNLFQAAVDAGAGRLIHTGTSHEYGDQISQAGINPISTYAASKAAAWAFCQMYARTNNWPAVGLRLFQVYGPGQSGTIIPAAIAAGLEGRSFPTTAGEQVRDWVYIDDVIDAYVQVGIVPDINGLMFDIGTGQGTQVREIVQEIFRHFPEATPIIGALPYRPGEIMRQVADTTHARERLNWRARVSLVEGLERTIDAMRGTASDPRVASIREQADRRRTQQADVLHDRILEQVTEYYRLVHEPRTWQPGDRVQYAGRVFDHREMRLMTEALLEFWLTAGRHAETFEKRLGNYLGVREVIPVNSGSSANLVAMTALCSKRVRGRHLEPGDEVITTAVAFPTTLAPIIQNRLIPVLVDSQMGTYNIDVSQLETALSPRTRALFVTHTLGNPVEMDVVMEFARAHDLYVIEDNCDALGSKYDGRYTGTFGDIATSSFYPAHHITLGEGGAVYTNDPHLARIARTVRDWGRDCWCGYTSPPNGQCGKRFEWEVDGLEGHYDHRYLFTEIGYNLKLTDPLAAIGVAQLEKLPDFVEARKRNFSTLYQGIAPLEDFFVLPTWSARSEPSWFAFPLTIRPGAPFDRDSLQRYLEGRNIETRLLFAGNIMRQPGYRDAEFRVIGKLPVANQVMGSTIFVGVYPGLGQAQLSFVIESFHEFVKNPARALASIDRS